jgi:uncharacterized membrane protein YfcA
MHNPYIVLGTGLCVGILSGFLGIGGGVVMVPIMVFMWKVEQHKANATSLAVILPTSIVGSIMYQQQGNLDVILAVKIALGGIVGAYFGSILACRLPAATLKKLFGGLLIFIGVRMVMG